MTSKSKKRVILPTRPEPPTIEQILEDVRSARQSDPVFASLAEGCEEFLAPVRAEVLMPDVETQYQQSKAYVELNKRLQEELSELASQSEELKKAGEQLDRSISEIKDKNFQN
ncbi:UPF0449 protein C19orf25 homolog [Cetorhinus maximus]|uniref:UPF0449 protein C19orf25 homolog n=1 Tax=Carcharodon carcharias TaxID=13397 RepID=UPI001B7F6157|nr:UPF0449 protein C19orf25 homolog [Carcharodon carcharias]XP_041059849.1 UPF0449 protein C19orf25 homolog [Carcharodon carcharias]XP_041059850.1 UPF0449 protein C19orf25 homolog [Carcharodon carcharias]